MNYMFPGSFGNTIALVGFGWGGGGEGDCVEHLIDTVNRKRQTPFCSRMCCVTWSGSEVTSPGQAGKRSQELEGQTADPAPIDRLGVDHDL